MANKNNEKLGYYYTEKTQKSFSSNFAKELYVMKTATTLQCLELLCSLCDATISFNLTKALENTEKSGIQKNGNFPSLPFPSFALPLLQSDSCTSPTAQQILLPPFAFVFWISPENQC